MTIARSHWFPIYGFSTICSDLDKLDSLKQQQDKKILDLLQSINCPKYLSLKFNTIEQVLSSSSIAESYKIDCIFCLVANKNISLDDLESYLKSFESNRELVFKKLLCLYDQMKYKA